MAVFCLELLFQALLTVWCFKASTSSLEFIIETVNNPPKKFLWMWPWTAVWESRRRAGKTAGHCCSRKDTSPESTQSTRWESEADNLRRVLPFWFSFRHPETQAVLLHENSAQTSSMLICASENSRGSFNLQQSIQGSRSKISSSRTL